MGEEIFALEAALVGVYVLAVWARYVETLVVVQVKRVLAVYALVLGGPGTSLTILITIKAQMQHRIQVIISHTTSTIDKTITSKTSSWTIYTLIIGSIQESRLSRTRGQTCGLIQRKTRITDRTAGSRGTGHTVRGAGHAGHGGSLAEEVVGAGVVASCDIELQKVGGGARGAGCCGGVRAGCAPGVANKASLDGAVVVVPGYAFTDF